ncbi:MAG: polysaccharide biosynthesis/export family protein [Flavobacteriales bacterium]|nr:polysaccharide biosynthesis/export family protein [Flavobacteriales bacterium]
MNFNTLKTSVIVILILALYACNINPSIMMRTKKGYPYDTNPKDSTTEYRIQPSDILEFQLYTNEGTRLIDLTALSTNPENRITTLINPTYLVEYDGNCKFPVIGRLNIKEKTIKELEVILQEEYAKYYIKPFVQIHVLNRRITIFTGIGKAQVFTLKNENTTLIEALGAVGGLSKDAKAHRIKLVRGNLKNPKVYLFNFKYMEGIKDADFVLKANDIIYVEPRRNILGEAVSDIAPIVSLLTSTITLILVINNLNK